MSPTRPTTRKGLMIVLSSPSGAGKSTISRRLLGSDQAFTLSVSATTRPQREGEEHGKHYLFVDHAAFDQMVDDGEMLEHATVFGNKYGTPAAPVKKALDAGKDVLFDVDWQGAQQLGQSQLSSALVTIFILPPSIAELERRLKTRAQDTEAVIASRMAKARDEISHWAEYDFVLINDDLDVCFSQIETIISGERLRRPRQPALSGFVASLNAEFEQRRVARGDDTAA
ncbi:MAG: guanylate kinase [Pseudomonadota bacterium]